MLSTKSVEPSSINPYQLTEEQLFAIGRVIRACAEIEHIATLYLYKLARIEIGTGEILVGRQSMRTKLAMARNFAVGTGGAELATFKECFERPEFDSLMKFRNVMAHGTLLGKTDMGFVAFQVADQVEHSNNSVSLEVITYSDETFAIFADMANYVIPQIENALGMQDARNAVRTGVLEPTAGTTKPKRNRRRKWTENGRAEAGAKP